MEIASPQSVAYAAIAALRPPAPPPAVTVAGPAGPLAAQAPTGAAAASARVQLSPLGQVASAVGSLLSSASVTGIAGATQAATRIAQAIAVLDQSISSLAQVSDGNADELDFLSGAEFSQRLLASGLTDSVNGRATAASLEALGLRPQPGGAFEVDRAALEQSFRTDPAGVLALITDYARNLDGFFAQRAGALLDRSTLAGASIGDPGGSGLPASLGDFATRQALAAFRANSLL
jgi:hypothetical protein